MKLDPLATEFVQRSQQQRQAEAEAQAAKPSRETRLRPHEIGRTPRTMNITFPSRAWPVALRELAELRGLRPGDLIVWCVSYAIAQIQDRAVTAPSGIGRKQHHKAMGWTQLLWEPEETGR